MNLGNSRVMPTDYLSNRNNRDMIHHLPVHLHLKINMGILVRIRRTSYQYLHSLRVVWHEEVTEHVHVIVVVESTQKSVGEVRKVASSVENMVT